MKGGVKRDESIDWEGQGTRRTGREERRNKEAYVYHRGRIELCARDATNTILACGGQCGPARHVDRSPRPPRRSF